LSDLFYVHKYHGICARLGRIFILTYEIGTFGNVPALHLSKISMLLKYQLFRSDKTFFLSHKLEKNLQAKITKTVCCYNLSLNFLQTGFKGLKILVLIAKT